MIETFKYRIQPAILELHETLVAQMSDCPLADALGEDLDQLRGDGTGRSIVLLAVMNDVLRMNQIALESHPEIPSRTLDAILPFCQSVAKTFATKGLDHYQPYTDLQRESIESFFDFYRTSRLPFTAESPITHWSGLQICRNVALQTRDGSVVDAYEQLVSTVIEFLDEIGLTRRHSPAIGSLEEFLLDSCEDIRDDLSDHSADRNRMSSSASRELDNDRQRLLSWQKNLNHQQNELTTLRSDLQRRLADLHNRETRLGQLQDELAREREKLSELQRQVQADRERLTIDQSAFEMRRQQIEEKPQPKSETVQSPNTSLDEERAALWKDREELALERDRLSLERANLERERRAWELEREQADQAEPSASGRSVSSDDATPPATAMPDGEEPDGHDLLSVLMPASQVGDLPTVRAVLDQIRGTSDENLVWGNRESNNAVLAATVGHDDEKYDMIVELMSETCPNCVRSAFPTLLQILRDSSSPPSARRRSAQAIGSLREDASQAIPILLGVLESEDRSVSYAASEAIAKIDSEAVVKEAIPYLNSILEQTQSSQQSRSWTANLLAARADLYRLSDQPQRALADYEESIRHRTKPNRTDEELCSQIREQLKNSPNVTKRATRT
ncbi:HEAT repeat domain-containing protein [Thalassoroseus pseudoceratinae]|uniref:HEAT repeat domain-containing protein n=1 Tax=Thalassoroseus pseudoceratinae TaxID=2713176 RepID=UPI00141DE225|nr:HEAT repeat domain-containing protein [Thalassoroseus pseudoceratinae]